MSFELMAPVGAFVTVYMIFKFMSSLAEGEHEMLKFGLSGFAFVVVYQMWLFIADISQEATSSLPGLESMIGRWIWIIGTIMVVVFMYFLYSIIIQYVDWRNWKKKKNPFADTERRYFR